MRYLSLFSGIGGLDLGLDRAGWTCVGQVEIEPFAIAVLEKHWPNVRRWTDVRRLQADDVLAAVGPVDAIVGGFPCQPWSVAGRGLGTDDPRHLWPEYLRLVAGLRPRWVLGENVPGLLASGADLVLGDLEAQDYACWPVVLGADDVGAPHRRKRVFFIARRLADEPSPGLEGAERPQPAGSGARPACGGVVADADHNNRHEGGKPIRGGRDEGIGAISAEKRISVLFDGGCFGSQQFVANADRARPEERGGTFTVVKEQLAPQCGGVVADAARARSEAGIPAPSPGRPGIAGQPDDGGDGHGGIGADAWPARPGKPQHPWEEPRATEPSMGMSADGVPVRLVGWRRGALKGLGNAVVPQVAEVLGRAILEADDVGEL